MEIFPHAVTDVLEDHKPLGRVVERSSRRTLAIVSWVPVEDSGRQELHIAPRDRRVHRERYRGAIPSRSTLRDLNLPVDGHNCAANGPMVVYTEQDVAAIRVLCPCVHSTGRFTDRSVGNRQVKNVGFALLGPLPVQAGAA